MIPICAECGRCLDRLDKGIYQCLSCVLKERDAQLAARDRELAGLKESHAAFVAKVQGLIAIHNKDHGAEIWYAEAISPAIRELAALIPAETPTPER